MAVKTYRASCHCGAIRIEADLDLDAGTVRCNCSLCAKSRWWGISAKPDAVRVIAGVDHTFDYSFGSHAIRQHNCKTCGLRVYGSGHIEQMGGPFVAINVACIDGLSDETLAALPIMHCNGRDNDWVHEPAVKSYL